MGTIDGYPLPDVVKQVHRNHLGETGGGSYNQPFKSGGSYQFPGQMENIESGLNNFGARYYSPNFGRWNSADGLTAHVYDPQSLNKFTYVRNDPVNLVDPDGRDFRPLYEEDICTINGFRYPGSCSDWVIPFFRAPRQLTAFEIARVRLSAAQEALGNRSSFSEDCEKGLGNIPIGDGKVLTPQMLQEAALSVSIENGQTANLSIQDAYGQSGLQAIAGAEAQAYFDKTYELYMAGQNASKGRILDTFGANPYQKALTTWGGGKIYIDASRLSTNSPYMNEAFVGHELIHELFGVSDRAIQRALGIPFGDSKNINDWIYQNCVKGLGNY